MSSSKCLKDGCARNARARGYCHTHYAAIWRSENLEKCRASARLRHAKRFATDGKFREEVRRIKREYERTPNAQSKKRERETFRSQHDPLFIAGRILSESRCNAVRGFPLAYTREELVQILLHLEPKCGICGETGIHPLSPSGGKRRLSVDHDHLKEHDNFRGLLCYRCNIGLGHLGDTVEGVRKALDYLTQ